jgi:DNA-binding transcriptional LysR family regulator
MPAQSCILDPCSVGTILSTFGPSPVLGASWQPQGRRVSTIRPSNVVLQSLSSASAADFERHLGGYRHTKLGEELLPYAERVEEAVAAIGRCVSVSSNNNFAGTVRVTCSSTVSQRLKRTSLLEMFEMRFPGLRVELVITDRVLDLSKGEADIAIRSRSGEPEDENLVGRKIADQVWGLYASRGYLDRYGRPGILNDLGRHRIVQCNGVMNNLAAAKWLRAAAPDAKITAYSESWSGVVMAFKSGAGLRRYRLCMGIARPSLCASSRSLTW